MRPMGRRLLRRLPPGVAARVRQVRLGRRARTLERRLARRGTGSPAEGTLVTIVIPTRNARDRLTALLDGLGHPRTGYRSIEVIVVDNASGDGTAQLAGARPYPLVVLSNPVNRSFSESCNQGAAAGTGPLVLFLNDDVIPINPAWLGAMVALAESRPAGVVGAVLVHPPDHPTKSLKVQHRGIGLAWRGTVPGGENLQGDDPLTVAPGGHECFAATAACLLVRRRDFEAIGGFSPGYVYGWEDVDLCLRLPPPVVISGDAFLYHYESAAQSRWSERRRQANYLANSQHFAERWTPELARRLRAEMLGGQLPRRAVVVGAGHDQWIDPLVADLIRSGWDTTRIAPTERPRHDVGLVVSTSPVFEPFGRAPNALKVAWVVDGVAGWADRPGFDGYDLVATVTDHDHHHLDVRVAATPTELPPALGPGSPATPPETTHRYHYVVLADAGNDIPLDLLDPDPDEVVRLVGSGWDGPRARRYWRGEIPPDELGSVLAAARLAVDPTTDGLPVPPAVYQALAAGTLVLTRNRAGNRARFDGLLPEFGDRAELRSQLDRWLAADAEPAALAATLAERTRTLGEDRVERLLAAARVVVDAPRIGWRVGPPQVADIERWGDTHLARHLAAELRRLGFASRLSPLPYWDQASHQDVDIAVHLHGLTPYVPKPAHVNILWIISHPDLVSPRMCDRFDLVLVASPPFAEHLRSQVSVPVHPWLQGTNTRLFRPFEGDRPSPLVFVGNSRRQDRAMLRWALEAELPIEVYGADWEGRIPAAVVKATHVPNHALPELYGRSRVVVADHWPDMAAHGFVSNRVFDALACGTPVITDPVAGLEAVVGAGVEVVEGPEALAKAFRALDHDPDRWRLASQGGRRVVVERHGLDRRATELVEILETHREAIPRLGGVLDRRRHNP